MGIGGQAACLPVCFPESQEGTTCVVVTLEYESVTPSGLCEPAPPSSRP